MTDKPKVYMIDWKLLSEWWHADADCTEEEILDVICEAFLPSEDEHDGKATIHATREQIGQRLFGGFTCDEGGYHIYHATGCYTYLGMNSDFEPERRKEIWETLMEGNKDQKINKGAPFTGDYPG